MTMFGPNLLFQQEVHHHVEENRACQTIVRFFPCLASVSKPHHGFMEH